MRTATPAPRVAWHVSSRSEGGSGNCVEAGPVLDGSGRVAVRDTYDRGGPVLVYRSAGWTAFLTAVRSGVLARP
ncbi:DUF397 domain-containing protein [Solwaraspora sp. WMMD1047]|uniref:DUF397 domain-containing protein n=1 Tax=Solwaraspora sp. WMMD1047 TaxID=3016102 RepID=UPI002416E4A5|nr:DUF397 domain-containing protein [Solwaraspora sp. WMMD1047]MDG4834495.1 DUF397 domain-containing protein [Solwaraspora sp. WMMD1047]